MSTYLRGLFRGFFLFMMFLMAPATGAAELKLWKGGPAPALDLKDMEGKDHRLADYKGRVVLVNFWATWCAP